MAKEKIKLYFVTGIITLLPLVVTILVLVYVYDILFNILDIFPSFHLPYNLGILINMAIFGIIILLLGIFMDQYFGKRIHSHFEERLISRIPVIRLIYGSTKQIIGAFSEREKRGLLKTVFVEYPRKGVYALGFVTKEAERIRGKDMVAVLVPSPPNPISGALIYVEKSELIGANISVKEALKMIASGGLIGK